jgi:energy-coupling factor transporter ATP-binding protein EcfA2
MAITKVRIRNFRSIVFAEFVPQQYNVLVGANDSGKSNFLRALNLFFNNEVEPGSPFRFTRDFSRTAKTGKGKAQEVRIELFIEVPSNYRANEEVVWRKVWRADSPVVSERAFVSKTEISGRSKVLSWLDAHRYHYVPAVRGGEYFRSLMRDVHDTLAESYEAELRAASGAFIKDLRKHTQQIGRIISARIGLRSELQLPPDLRTLFEVLDFETDSGVSFRQRGDGVQAAHIPAILKFLADSQKRLAAKGKPLPTSIWAYEEPENNLEFTRAFSIAEQLYEYSSDHQVFLTTHSPAFYTGKSIEYKPNRWLVQSIDNESQIGSVGDGHSDDLHDVVGLMPLVAPFIRQMQAELDVVRKQVKATAKPTIFVGGITDERYIRRALDVFASERAGLVAVKFIGQTTATGATGGGDANLDKIVTVLREQQQLQSQRVVALFDCDATRETVTHGLLRVQQIRHNPTNTVQTRGIENSIHSSVFARDFYKTKTKTDKYGAVQSIEEFDKVAACDTVCKRAVEQLQQDLELLRAPLGEALDFLLSGPQNA